MRNNRNKAFTLIELLVVIAVIAVLMSILMPALRAAKDHAKRIQCVSNVKQLALAWTLYAQENDYHLVNAMVESANGAASNGRSRPWVLSPTDATGPVEVKLQAIRDGALWTYAGEDVDLYRCPADFRLKHPTNRAFRSYSIPDGANGEAWPAGESVLAKKLTDLKRPGEKYIFLEDVDPRGYNSGSWALQFTQRRWIDPLAVWHNRRSSMGFADGHAEIYGWSDQYFLDWCDKAVDQSLGAGTGFTFYLDVPAESPTDYDFMVNGWPCLSHR